MDSLKKLTKLKEHLQDLTRDEAYRVAVAILEGELSGIKTAAFLTAMRIKGENHEELMGIMQALTEKVNSPKAIPDALDLSLNYDGKVKTPYILPSAIAIATACGLRITYHYAERVPAKEGVTLYSVLKELDFYRIDKDRFAVIHQKEFIRELYGLLPLRRELGFRTMFNVLEKLLNPFRAQKIITSLFHRPYFEKMYKLCSDLGFDSFLLVKGMEGGVEPLPDRPTFYRIKGMETLKVQPSELGLRMPANVQASKVLEESVELNRRILEGEAPEEFVNWTLYSASFLLLAGGLVKDLKEGIQVAERGYTNLVKGETGA